ncbi:MAG: nicotinate-nucleotide adenylyltransferase [Colwellia polaris]|jgi:nicotinate-nucleotide adenylyltransferase
MNIAKQSAPKLIALLGGTFDPIHFGHILPAQETAKWLNAEQLFLIPVHIPPHKLGTHANAKHRANMVLLVCDTDPVFHLDNRELTRQSRSYTVDTLKEIKAEQPEADLYFIMGMDSLLTFTTWYCWQDILSLCNLVVNIRPGYNHQSLETLLAPELKDRLIYNPTEIQPQSTGLVLIHESQAVNISSTEIRAKIQSGKDYSQDLPAQVYHYIEQHKLYS